MIISGEVIYVNMEHVLEHELEDLVDVVDELEDENDDDMELFDCSEAN